MGTGSSRERRAQPEAGRASPPATQTRTDQTAKQQQQQQREAARAGKPDVEPLPVHDDDGEPLPCFLHFVPELGDEIKRGVYCRLRLKTFSAIFAVTAQRIGLSLRLDATRQQSLDKAYNWMLQRARMNLLRTIGAESHVDDVSVICDNANELKLLTNRHEVLLRTVRVTHLRVSGTVAGIDASLRGLRPLTLRDRLDLDDCINISNSGRHHGLSHLRKLDVAGVNVSDAGLAHVCTVETLEVLVLAQCDRITNASLACIGRSGLNALRSLDLSDCRLITDAGLMLLVDLPALAALCVSGCWELTDKSSKQLSSGTVAGTLRRLHIGGCFRMTGATLCAHACPKPDRTLPLP
jgi:hypothetical protein